MVLRLFKAYFFSKKSGSTVKMMAWLSLVGMALGVLGLILVLSIMAGFNDKIKERLLAYEPHVVVYTKNNELNKINEVLKQEFKNFKVLKFESQDVILRTASGAFQGALAQGFSKERIDSVLKESTIQVLEKKELSSNEVIVNFELSRALDIVEGDYIDLIPPENLLKPIGAEMEFKQYKLAHVFYSQLTTSKNSNIMIYSLDSLVRPQSKSIKRAYEILLENPEDSTKVKQKLLVSQFKKVETWQERNSSLLFALKLERLAIGVFLIISVLITSFSMMTVLLLLLHQKRQEIGILMALGISKFKIRILFGSVGVLLSVMGVGLGLIPGFVISKYIELHPLKIMPSMYQDPYLPSRVDPSLIFIVIFVCILICAISLIIPLLNLSQLTPSAALKSSVSD